MATVTVGEIVAAQASASLLGLDPINERPLILDYIRRALELMEFKGNWNPFIGEIDLVSGPTGNVVLPYYVEAALAVNVAGRPSLFQNSWFQYHINGPGSFGTGPTIGAGFDTGGQWGGSAMQFTWKDAGYVTSFQPFPQWSMLVALAENPADCTAGMGLTIAGDTQDLQGNQKIAIQTQGDNAPGPAIFIPFTPSTYATDPATTRFRSLASVTKPVTKGYVHLLAVSGRQGEIATTVGYYGPQETHPRYRMITVNSQYTWVRVKYRRNTLNFLYDWEILPIKSRQAMVMLLQAIKFSDTNNIDLAAKYEQGAVNLIMEAQSAEDGPGNFTIQVEPDYAIGTLDPR